MDPIWTDFRNFLSQTFHQFYFLFIYYFYFCYNHLKSLLFIRNNNGYDNDSKNIRQPKAILNDLMVNFEDSNLLNADESVEETFMRMIAIKQYDIAKKLAKKFDLDTDSIYTNIWLNSDDKTIELIDECFNKINDDQWILNECLNFIPKQLFVQKHLLEFGIEFAKKNEGYNEIGQKLSKYLERLNLYEKILQSKSSNNERYYEQYDWKFFEKFRRRKSFQLAIEYANDGDIEALSVLFAYDYKILAKNFFVILSNIPESILPSNYEGLIELSISTLMNDDSLVSTDTTDTNDEYERNFFDKNNDLCRYKISGKIDNNYLIQWFEYRSKYIFEQTLLINHSMDLLMIGIKRFHLTELKQLFNEYDIYSLLLYDYLGHQLLLSSLIGKFFTKNGELNQLNFEHFHRLNIEDKMSLLFNNDLIMSINDGQDDDTNFELLKNLFEKFFEKINSHESEFKTTKDLLKKFFKNLIENDNFQKCLKFFQYYTIVNHSLDELMQNNGKTNARNNNLLNDPCDLIELALYCIKTYKNPQDLDNAFKLMECIPEPNQLELINYSMKNNNNDVEYKQWLKRFEQLNNEADEIQYHLSMLEFLQENNTYLTVNDLLRISNESRNEQLMFVEKIVNNFCRLKAENDNDNESFNELSNEWKEFFINLKDFAKKYLRKIFNEDDGDQQKFIEKIVQCLLWSNNENFIKIAFQHIDLESTMASRNSNVKKLNRNRSKTLLYEIANDYIDHSNVQSTDTMINFAEMLLNFIQINLNDSTTNDSKTIELLNFIEAIKLLNEEFPGKQWWLPIHIRKLIDQNNHGNDSRQKLLKMILSSSKNSYKKINEILKIVSLLKLFENCNDDDPNEQEAKLLNIIGDYAIENCDYKIAIDLAKNIMDRNLKYGWKLCYQLCLLIEKNSNEFQDLIAIDQHIRLISFVLTWSNIDSDTDDDIDMNYRLLNQLKSIKQQHLNHLMEPKIFINFVGHQSIKV